MHAGVNVFPQCVFAMPIDTAVVLGVSGGGENEHSRTIMGAICALTALPLHVHMQEDTVGVCERNRARGHWSVCLEKYIHDTDVMLAIRVYTSLYTIILASVKSIHSFWNKKRTPFFNTHARYNSTVSPTSSFTLYGLYHVQCTSVHKGPFRLPYKTILHQPSDKIRLTKSTKNSPIY